MKHEEIQLEIKNIIFIVFGAILIDGSVWFNPPHTGYSFLVPIFLGACLIFIGIFNYSPIEFYRIKRGLYRKETGNNTIIQSENNNDKLPLEEQYYYNGRTNQQLQRYNEAWHPILNHLDLIQIWKFQKRH